jgi:DNA-binding FadR family transcriptional regulator
MPSTLSSHAGAHERGARPRLAQQVATAVSDRIHAGELLAGNKLPPESELVRTYGVSRTVVREAISQLQAAGLVETRHGIGTFVLETPPAARLRVPPEHLATVVDVMALLELRTTLESEAAALAAARRTDADLVAMRTALDAGAAALTRDQASARADFEFHLAIARATGNRYYGDLMEHLGAAVIPRTRVDSTQLGTEPPAAYMARLSREHDAIFDAVARQDPEAARAAMRTHLVNSRERLRRAHAASRSGD